MHPLFSFLSPARFPNITLPARFSPHERYVLTLLFFLYKAKGRSTGEAPLYARISVKGKKRAQFSTGIWVRPEHWLPAGNGFVLGKSRLHRSYNERLENIRADINSIYADLERRGRHPGGRHPGKQVITPQIVKAIYTGEKEFALTFLRAGELFLAAEERDPDLSPATIRNHKAKMRNLRHYLEQAKELELQCSEVGIKTLRSMEQFFRQHLKHGQAHTNRLLQFARKIMDYAVEQEACPYNPLHSYSFKKVPRKQKVYLNTAELHRLVTYQFASARLARIARLFAFQCLTGFSYAELMRFDRSWISKGIDGRDWIFGDRKKVAGSQYAIPVFSTTRRILEELNYTIPRISNGNYNAFLKEVAFILDIDKNLTTHVGRKTFGNLLHERAVSLASVSAMYGHSNTKTTQDHYVDTSFKLIAKETAGIDF